MYKHYEMYMNAELTMQRRIWAHLSEPAKSTKLSLPLVTFWVCRLVASMMTLMMR